jgi:hypothetical protein
MMVRPTVPAGSPARSLAGLRRAQDVISFRDRLAEFARTSAQAASSRSEVEWMALSAFADRACPPSPSELRQALAVADPLWHQIITHASESCPPITEQWNYANARWGWSVRLKCRDRVLLYLTPQTAGILVGVVLGEKAAQSAHAADLPGPVLELIDNAPRYAEGRGIRLVVATDADLAVVRHLLALKSGAVPAPVAPRAPARAAPDKSPRRTRKARR